VSLAENAARMIAARGTAVTLVRTATAAPAADTPWIPGAATETEYELDAFVRGVTEQYVDGQTVIASDLMVVASPKARLDGAVVEIEPQITDQVEIAGARKAIKRISPAPAAGPAALFRIFVAS
jgi:hypothetical protein